MLEIPDRWVWDFWHARDGVTHHLFFLTAPRSLGDPDLRHWHVSIGHATSNDLRDWTVHDEALRPGAPGSFDDHVTWTGSVIADGESWVMLYTGGMQTDWPMAFPATAGCWRTRSPTTSSHGSWVAR